MSKARVLRCTCDHDFQSRKHGRRRRVFNAMHGDKNNCQKGKIVGWRCTVCGNEKRL